MVTTKHTALHAAAEARQAQLRSAGEHDALTAAAFLQAQHHGASLSEIGEAVGLSKNGVRKLMLRPELRRLTHTRIVGRPQA